MVPNIVFIGSCYKEAPTKSPSSEFKTLTTDAGVGVSSGMQSTDSELSDVSTQLRTMRQLIARLQSLNVDPTEYACLKAIVLFKPGNYKPQKSVAYTLFVPLTGYRMRRMQK